MKSLTWATLATAVAVWLACSVALDLDQYDFPEAPLEPAGSGGLNVMQADEAPDAPTPTPDLWDSPTALWDTATWN
jgi:hypothetical protein